MNMSDYLPKSAAIEWDKANAIDRMFYNIAHCLKTELNDVSIEDNDYCLILAVINCKHIVYGLGEKE